jgi:decaprenyl-phosphate phosphoribosyltransferase
MMKTSAVLQVIRVKHWPKNLLVFAAPLGAGTEITSANLQIGFLGFLGFSLSASAVYVLNDYNDRNIDKKHPVKKYRPIAAGLINKRHVPFIVFFLTGFSILAVSDFSLESQGTLLMYFVLNLAYTYKLKTIAVLELGIVAFGYSLRILFGAQIFSLVASSWLMISTFCAAFGIIAAKRRAEVNATNRDNSDKRQVLANYNSSALHSVSGLAFGISFTTYSLWLFEHPVDLQVLPLACEMLGLVLLAFLLIESDRGKLESPEDLLKSGRFITIFAIFATLNLILLYI